MSILISQRVSNLLSTIDSIPNDKLTNITKYILQLILIGKSSIEIEDDFNMATIAISTLFLEASKVKASTELFRSFLSDLAINEATVNLLGSLYDTNKSAIIEYLGKISITAPELVAVDWRLDYSIRSKHAGRSNIPLFFVNLLLKEKGIVRDVELIASQEELQDMLSKVRDAVKQTERILKTPNTTDTS